MDAFSTNAVTKSEELFGRTDFINDVIDSIHGMNNCAIIGSRRFGKTSVLQHIKYKINSDDKIFPVLVDSRDIGNSQCDTSDVYRCLVAMLSEELYNAGVFVEKETFDLTKEIIPWGDWGAIYQQVCQYNEKNITSLFKSMVNYFAKKMNKTILFMIDEYEYLLTKSMNPEGFNYIRNLTKKPIEGTNLMPLKYIICGAKNWEIFQREIDSGVLNETGVTEYLKPISEEDFKAMWRYETSKKDVKQMTKALLMQKMDWAYKMSGGVPFYGKLIGNYICRQNACPDYSELRPFFRELVLKQLSQIQLSIIINIVDGIKPDRTDSLIELEEEGIIFKEQAGNYKICIGFLVDYIKANYDDIIPMIDHNKNNRVADDEYINLVDDIFLTIKDINSTRRSKNQDLIFHPTDSDDTQTRMKTICSSKIEMESFAKHAFITYFERTSNYNNGERIKGTYGASLPDKFKTKDSLYGAIQVFRHFNLHSDFENKPNQMSLKEALDFFGFKTLPVEPKEMGKLQLNFLKRISSELKKILSYVQKEENN